MGNPVPKQIFVYACQLCDKRFDVPFFGISNIEPKLTAMHKDCEGGLYPDLKNVKGVGILIGERNL